MTEFNYGATPLAEGGVCFRVWAPHVQTMAVKIGDRVLEMARDGENFQAVDESAQAGDSYSFLLNG